MSNMKAIANTAMSYTVVKRVNFKSSHHKEKFFSFLLFFFLLFFILLYLHEKMYNHFIICINQTIKLQDTLNLCSDICQLFLNKIGKTYCYLKNKMQCRMGLYATMCKKEREGELYIYLSVVERSQMNQIQTLILRS